MRSRMRSSSASMPRRMLAISLLRLLRARRERHLLTSTIFLTSGSIDSQSTIVRREHDVVFLAAFRPAAVHRWPAAAHAPQGQAAQLRTWRGVVELEQQLARLPRCRPRAQDLADDAALEMLDDLVLPGSDEDARRDHRAGDRRHVAPDAESHHHHGHDHHAGIVGRLVDRGSVNRTRFRLLAAERSAMFLVAIA